MDTQKDKSSVMRPSRAAVMEIGRNCKFATGVACPRCEACDNLANPDCVQMCWDHLDGKACVQGKEGAMHALERRQSPQECSGEMWTD